MAQKPVKKAVAKKAVAPKATVKKTAVKAAPAAKKAPVKKVAVKKTTTKATTKVMAAPAPEAKAAMAVAPAVSASSCGCGGGCDCGCQKKCGGFWRFVKKLIIFVIIFALGFATAKLCMYGKHEFHKGPRMPDVFVNGCLDVAKIQCPEMAQKVAMADANADGCITKEEFRSFKKEMRKDVHGDRPCGMMEMPEMDD